LAFPTKADGGVGNVPATFSLQRGQIDISTAFTKVAPAAGAWCEEVLRVLRRTHEQAVAAQP
jgi:hypothetical protein